MSGDPQFRVLLVDDDPVCLRLMRVLLESEGFEVIEATDGVDGLAKVLEQAPHLVVTDWMMPGIDGLEMIRRIRAEQLPWYPYILLLTAGGDQAVGLDSGADDFVSKPVRKNEVLARMRAARRIVALQQSLRQNNLQLHNANERLTVLAVTDPLTGLLNRRVFFERAQQEWQRAQRYGLKLCSLMLDIDHFKNVNDTYGHGAGDKVIRALAQMLTELLRKTDVLCRFGGEEFAMLLIETSMEDAVMVAERIRVRASELRLPEISGELRLGVSLGVAACGLETTTEGALIDHADQALLVAKRTGRDRVVRHDELLSTVNLCHELPPATDRNVPGLMVPYQVVNALLAALRFRDQATVEHTRRVAQACREFGQHLGLEPADRVMLEMAALLHDIGKLATPDDILHKTGRLTFDEFAIAQRHREVTVNILQSCFSTSSLVDIVRFSDRWFDGSHGEPSGHEIPLSSRILSIVSLFDDVVHGRMWWAAHAPAEALDIVDRWSGAQLDPELVQRFRSYVESHVLALV